MCVVGDVWDCMGCRGVNGFVWVVGRCMGPYGV